MDLDTIRAFLTVADGGTVTEAAEQAHRTQPTVSRALGRLEREVGTPLFQRVGRGLVLTLAGRELVLHARETIESYERGCARCRTSPLRTAASCRSPSCIPSALGWYPS
ncbi:LysR family transcriptional regulator [Nocardioides alcanivorans]|uniref:LysR family transcriptional regulator n=1 Tax=Nocardioides alcanivorans TaxID=2897352 RepID=UPI0035E01D73